MKVDFKNLRTKKDFMKLANKNLNNMKKFAIESDFIEKETEDKIIILNDQISILNHFFYEYEKDKHIKTAMSYVSIEESVIFSIEVMISNIFNDYRRYTNNLGYINPLMTILSICKALERNRFLREKNLLKRNLQEVDTTIKKYFSDNYIFIVMQKIEEIYELIKFHHVKLEKFLLENKKKENIIEAENIKKVFKKTKIFDFKEMNNLLIQNGFEPIRQKGSHKMFSNGEYTIPVPQHKLGKGLSFEIQSQIKVSTS
ncbi:MAG: type II toxin-antitoxin system HicA family toxin [Clostridium sp.]|uniref:type II toxin-antitoxin system HicA family toxin n=1 Tax=Clostridium sp. TaxID=1506 RepID=UPI003F2D86FB